MLVVLNWLKIVVDRINFYLYPILIIKFTQLKSFTSTKVKLDKIIKLC